MCCQCGAALLGQKIRVFKLEFVGNMLALPLGGKVVCYQETVDGVMRLTDASVEYLLVRTMICGPSQPPAWISLIGPPSTQRAKRQGMKGRENVG